MTTDAQRSRYLYFQSAKPSSPYHADQTKLLAAGQWVPERFTEDQIAASPGLDGKAVT